MSTVPFYQDWTFWQWVVSLTALGVSLTPPIRRLFKGPKLAVETHDRVGITHTVGNPNITLFVILQNTGGQPVRVRSIDLNIKPDGSEAFIVPAKSYYPLVSENKQTIFAPFKLALDQDWSHTVYFFNPFSRNDEQLFRQLVSNLKSDIDAKQPVLGIEQVQVEANPVIVQPVFSFFDQRFKWHPGEYEVTLTVHTDPARATVSKRLRFTLFETDSKELRNYTEQYKYGLGVLKFDYVKQPGVWVPLVNA